MGIYPPPGNSYRYQNKGVIEFDGWKLLKTKGRRKRVKLEAFRKVLKIGETERYRRIWQRGATGFRRGRDVPAPQPGCKGRTKGAHDGGSVEIDKSIILQSNVFVQEKSGKDKSSRFCGIAPRKLSVEQSTFANLLERR